MEKTKQAVPSAVPRHVAIIMDGNNRWAKKRFLPGVAGHKAGVDAVRAVIEVCAEAKVEVLTLFAFSSENWQRPADEVSALMDLFFKALRREAKRLNDNNISLRIIGDRSRFHPELQAAMREAEAATAGSNRFICRSRPTTAGNGISPRLPSVWPVKCRLDTCVRMTSRRTCCKPAWQPVICRCRTCVSAPAVSIGSATSCCGSWRMPSCISPTCSGRTSNTMPCAMRWLISLPASVVSVKRASRSKPGPGFNAQATHHHGTYSPAYRLVRVFSCSPGPVLRCSSAWS